MKHQHCNETRLLLYRCYRVMSLYWQNLKPICKVIYGNCKIFIATIRLAEIMKIFRHAGGPYLARPSLVLITYMLKTIIIHAVH